MDNYYLFLDESQTHTNGANFFFCVAGFIVKKEDYESILTPELNSLKSNIWKNEKNPTNLVLHEKEVREAANRSQQLKKIKGHFRLFRQKKAQKDLYNGMADIAKNANCTVIGAVVEKDLLNQYFDTSSRTDEYLMSMQIILENFCQFLQKRGATGCVFVESRGEQDSIVRMHYNHVKAMGTMFVNPQTMQLLLKEIEFPEKNSNNPGLQVADFVPNPLARNAAKKGQYKPNIYQTLRVLRYDGGVGKQTRFGVKLIP